MWFSLLLRLFVKKNKLLLPKQVSRNLWCLAESKGWQAIYFPKEVMMENDIAGYALSV